MKKKRISAFLLALLLAAQTTGCTGSPDVPAQETADAPAQASEVPAEEPEAVEIEEQADSGAVKWGEYGGLQEQIMRLKTGIYDRELTPDDLLTVTELTLDSECIYETEWLSYLTNLTVLKLVTSSGGGVVKNLDHLSALTGLTELDLTGQEVTDISGLSGLTNLTTLTLDCQMVNDVSALSGLTKLTTLTLEGVKPDHLDAVSGLTGLTALTLDFSGADGTQDELDLSALSGLTGLTTLVLDGKDSYRIKDIQFLSGMTDLTTLIISRDGRVGLDVLDLGVLSGLTGLTTLELGMNIDYEAMDAAAGSDVFSRRYDLTPLSALTNLEVLRLGYMVAYMDLDALSGLVNLKTLDLYPITSVMEEGSLVAYGGDMSCLSGLTNLSELILRDLWDINQIASIPALPNLTSLSVALGDDQDSIERDQLDAAGVRYTNADPIWENTPEPFANLEQVTTLVILEGRNNRHPNLLKMFLRMPNVTTLVIEEGDCMDLAVGEYSEWPNVTTLTLPNGTLGGMSVSGKGWDPAWNEKVPNVTDLTLNNFSGDLSALSGLSGLSKLTLNNCKGDMEGKLSELPNLTELRVKDCSYNTTAGLSDMTNLTVFEIEGGNSWQSSSKEEASPYSYHALAGLPNLTTVKGVFQELEEISKLPKLETIRFPYGSDDVSALYDLPDLTILWE